METSSGRSIRLDVGTTHRWLRLLHTMYFFFYSTNTIVGDLKPETRCGQIRRNIFRKHCLLMTLTCSSGLPMR